MRPPAPKIRFQVTKWIPINELTEEERLEYDKEQAAIQEEKQNQQMELQEQQQEPPQGDQHRKQKENEVEEVATTPEVPKNEVSLFEPGNVDISATNPQLSEQEISAGKRELPHSSTAPTDEPPNKRTKVDEQVPVQEFPMV